MSSLYMIPVYVLGLFILLACFFIVKQQTAVVIERFGRFQSIRNSGLQMKIPLVDRIAGRLSLKIQQLDVIVETKTLDDVFVKLKEKEVGFSAEPDKSCTWRMTSFRSTVPSRLASSARYTGMPVEATNRTSTRLMMCFARIISFQQPMPEYIYSI